MSRNRFRQSANKRSLFNRNQARLNQDAIEDAVNVFMEEKDFSDVIGDAVNSYMTDNLNDTIVEVIEDKELVTRENINSFLDDIVGEMELATKDDVRDEVSGHESSFNHPNEEDVVLKADLEYHIQSAFTEYGSRLIGELYKDVRTLVEKHEKKFHAVRIKPVVDQARTLVTRKVSAVLSALKVG